MAARDEFAAIHKYLSDLPVFSDHEHHLPDSFFAEKVTLDAVIRNSYISMCAERLRDGSYEGRKGLVDDLRFNTYLTWLAEECIGVLQAWRFVVAKVLSERIADGLLNAKGAEDLARKFMYENNRAIYCPDWKP